MPTHTTISVTNLSPSDLIDPADTIQDAGPFNFDATYTFDTIAKHVFEPLDPTLDVTATVNGAELDTDDLARALAAATDEMRDLDLEADLSTLLEKTCIHFDPASPLPLDAAYVIEAVTRANSLAKQTVFPYPTNTIVYTDTTDVIPAAKSYIAGKAPVSDLFVSLAFAHHPNTLGIAFRDTATWNDFTQNFAPKYLSPAASLPADTRKLWRDLANLDADTAIAEALQLRDDTDAADNAYSFARTFIEIWAKYVKANPDKAHIMAFSIAELAQPTTVTLINISATAFATPNEVTAAWADTTTALAGPAKIIDHASIRRLSALPRAVRKAQASAQARAKDAVLSKSAPQPISEVRPTPKSFIARVMAVINRMGNVAKSENCYRAPHTTYMRPNRRDPDDYNKPGKTLSTKYHPDIHLYLDTSGSISEQNYADAVALVTMLAAKLDVNLYVNSFSHVISRAAHVPAHSRSPKQIATAIMRLPKVSGGTDFANVWRYINASRRRRRELSLIVTDFEYNAGSAYIEHPKNLYYLPCSAMDWDSLRREAQRFCDTTGHIEPDMRKHILC